MVVAPTPAAGFLETRPVTHINTTTQWWLISVSTAPQSYTLLNNRNETSAIYELNLSLVRQYGCTGPYESLKWSFFLFICVMLTFHIQTMKEHRTYRNIFECFALGFNDTWIGFPSILKEFLRCNSSQTIWYGLSSPSLSFLDRELWCNLELCLESWWKPMIVSLSKMLR